MKVKKTKGTGTENQKSMKKFMVLVAGEFISSVGSGLTSFGLAIYILGLTGSVTATGIFGICAFLPSILLAPIGGILADRYDRRMMMILGELLSGLGLLICLASVMSTSPSLSVICAGMALSAVFTSLTEPAFKATVTDLLSEEDFARAGGMVQIANSAKMLISPAIAGLLLQVTGVFTLIIIDMLTFFTTVIIIAAVRKELPSREKTVTTTGFIQELKDGVTAIGREKGVMALIVMMTIAVFCLGFVQILSKPLVLAIAGETELGILTTVIALGMMAGSIGISLLKQEKSYHRMLSFGMIGCGIFFALIGVTTSLMAIAAFGFMMFVFMPAIQISAEVLIRKNIANTLQGRVFGLIGLISQMGYILAYLFSGMLADFVFEPFMQGHSRLAGQIGEVIGTGIGRGDALLVILTGLGLVVTGLVAARLKSIKMLEGKEITDAIAVESCPEGL